MHSDCIATIKKWKRKRVIEFLKGMNLVFERRRATVFHQTTLPTLEDAITAISQEETTLKVMATQPVTHLAFVVSKTRGCFSCGQQGHVSCSCPNRCKFNRCRRQLYGKCGQRGGTRGRRKVGYKVKAGSCGRGGLLEGKKVVSCKWVYTVNKILKGK